MSNDAQKHRKEVKAAILRTLLSGCSTVEDVLIAVGSPDPKLVRELFDEITKEISPKTIKKQRIDLNANATRARRLSANLPLELPAPDPIRCQWWFTLDSVEKLANKILEYSVGGGVAFLGAPTLGFYYAHWLDSPVTILDADKDVIESLKLPPHVTKQCYDVIYPVPQKLQHKHIVVFIDPPWYPELIESFISRACTLATEEAFIICALPPRLTRPAIIEERTHLVEVLLHGKFEIVALESEYIKYRVPTFERYAYSEINDFSGRFWRKGDLLVLRTNSLSVLEPHQRIERDQSIVFARDKRITRFFMNPNRAVALKGHCVVPVSEFANSVSARGVDLKVITVWGTNRRAASVRDVQLINQILEMWAEGMSREETIEHFTKAGKPDDYITVDELNESLALWAEPSVPKWRRTPKQLQEKRELILTKFASQPSDRDNLNEKDGFRLDFQRDRDRVLWSDALKRLANKTQLFPVTSDDHLRRRLTHSIEVMQLASTIATSFGLDRDLTEAGALAHDVGHAPFGHAGEYALDYVIKETDQRLGGFNHYEHGVDVVRWLECVYRSPAIGGFPGLDLVKETVECILKHCFYRDNEPLGQSTLVKNSKHKDIDDASCHMEGQAVRIADKISYLISDLEDGIRMGVFSYENLMACRFFERPPIDMAASQGETLHQRFISQRRAILKVLMEDIIRSTDERLMRLGDLSNVRATRKYTVDFSEPIGEDVGEIWKVLQAGKLHKHPSVKAENMQASKIVRDLFLLYAIEPELVDPIFRDLHYGLAATPYVAWYRNQLGRDVGIPKKILTRYSYERTLGVKTRSQADKWLVPLKDVLLAKDYVASLTDTSATEEYKKYCQEM
jgi:dGTPase